MIRTLFSGLRRMAAIGLLLVTAVQVLSVSAQSPTSIHVWRNDGPWPRVSSFPINRLDSVLFRSDDPSGAISRILFASHDRAEFISKSALDRVEFGTNVPTVFITTDPLVYDITSKTDYLPAIIRIDGYGRYDDTDTTALQIRGRGNSSWGFPKKPYRLKFSKKISLCNLGKAKNFVLIANYLDPTLMKNATAFELARLLGLPWTNHSIPVNVWLNGRFKGSYMLSEKVGINAGSVDIDEESAIMWELDQSFDEDYRFMSDLYGLPVMVKDPDPLDLIDEEAGETAEEWLAAWHADFSRMEEMVSQGRVDEVIDIPSAVRYMLVNLIAGNSEVGWPKSVYLYKESPESLYKMGPVWDFDWAFGFECGESAPLLSESRPGYEFMKAIVDSGQFREELERVWSMFRSQLYPQLERFMFEYAASVRVSAFQDGEEWPDNPDIHGKVSSERFDEAFNDLLNWIDRRVANIGSHPDRLLY